MGGMEGITPPLNRLCLRYKPLSRSQHMFHIFLDSLNTVKKLYLFLDLFEIDRL